MLMNIVSLGIVLLVGWVWMSRGMFNAFMHLVCVFAAGAIALAVFEPVGSALMGFFPKSSGMLRVLEASAPAMSIILPFALSLAVIRLTMDKIVPANVTLTKQGETIGGLICGLLSGVIVSGIMVIGLNQLWMGKSIGYDRLAWDNTTGALTRVKRLWVPTDDIVAGVYGRLSMTTLESTPDSALGRVYPDLADVGSALRSTASDGKGRTVIRPADLSLSGSYTVGLDQNGQRVAGLDNAALLRERDGRQREHFDITGESLSRDQGLHLAGYILNFQSGAFESGISQVIIRANQFRLVCVPTSGEGDPKVIYPVAIISRGVNLLDEEVGFVRWSAGNLDIPSVAGGSAAMAIEFIVPSGYEPRTLHAKNLRLDARTSQPTRYVSPGQRDSAIESGAMFAGSSREFSQENAVDRAVPDNLAAAGVYEAGRFPSGFGFIDQGIGGIQVAERRLITGTITVDDTSRINVRTAGDPSARDRLIQGFTQRRGEEIFTIQIRGQLTLEGATGLLVDAANPPLRDAPTDRPVMLVDRQGGETFECIGYIYQDASLGVIRFDRNSPIRGLADLPKLPQPADRNQRIFLVFVTSQFAKPDALAVGDEILYRFSKPLEPRLSAGR